VCCGFVSLYVFLQFFDLCKQLFWNNYLVEREKLTLVISLEESTHASVIPFGSFVLISDFHLAMLKKFCGIMHYDFTFCQLQCVIYVILSLLYVVFMLYVLHIGDDMSCLLWFVLLLIFFYYIKFLVYAFI